MIAFPVNRMTDIQPHEQKLERPEPLMNTTPRTWRLIFGIMLCATKSVSFSKSQIKNQQEKKNTISHEIKKKCTYYTEIKRCHGSIIVSTHDVLV